MNISEKLSTKYLSMPPSKMTRFFNLPSDVISLAVGDTGFSTPVVMSVGGISAIKIGATKYPPSNGYYELRHEIANHLLRCFNFAYSADEVLVTMGASLGLDCIMRAFLDYEDEVLIPKPAYGYYATLAGLSGAKPVFVPTYAEDGWALTTDNLKRAITPKTKLLILNYPNNPTGASMTAKQFEDISAVIRHTEIIVVSDEIYAECSFASSHDSILHQTDMRDRTILVSGFSKSMAMTGWRAGYICATKELLSPVAAINAAVTLCAPSISQAAAVCGLRNGQQDVEYMTSEYKRRRDYVAERSTELGWNITIPDGAFYLWADISSYGMDSESFSQHLLENAKVAVVPGTVFGDEYTNYIRLTYSYSMDVLEEAFDRIQKLCTRFNLT